MKQAELSRVTLLLLFTLALALLSGCGSASADSAESDSSRSEANTIDNAPETVPDTNDTEGGEAGNVTDPAIMSANWRETAVHMRLLDDLDRPQDGWCLDVVGSGPHIRFDMPLIAHNIKPGLYADEAVEFTADGQIRFPAYPGYCVTVMGLNQYALPGAALMLKECGAELPFLNAPKFQTFELLENNQVRLVGSDLCITVGAVSERTFDPTHAWRTLYMERCEDCDLSRSTWKFVRP